MIRMSMRMIVVAVALTTFHVKAQDVEKRVRSHPILLINPSGGEMYVPGRSQGIILGRKTRAKLLLVELSRDGGVTFETVGTIDNTVKERALRNRLDWTPALPESGTCVIRVTSTDSRKPGTVLSKEFSIGSPELDTSTPDGRYVLLTGDAMTGLLTLSGDPTQNLDAATKQYVDGQLASADHGALQGLPDDDHLQYLNRNGVRPMTGALDLGSQNIVNGASATFSAQLQVDGSSTLGSDASDSLTINAGPVNLPNAKSASDGLILGGDVNLYRDSANRLRTDGNLYVRNQLHVTKIYTGVDNAPQARRVLDLIPGRGNESPCIVGGSPRNLITLSLKGATISGGGNLNIGWENKATDDYCTIGGGSNNIVGNDDGTADNARHATVAGGFINKASATNSFVGGGVRNVANFTGAAVVGGHQNFATGLNAFVGAGDRNVSSGNSSVVGGGIINTSTNSFTSVGGGFSNDATAARATVSGGYNNSATGTGASIGGGQQNNATGLNATVPGGLSNIAKGDYSFASGRNAQANHIGSFVWVDGNGTTLGSSANHQFTARASGGVRFFSNLASSSGVTLAAGANAWASVSDRNKKKNIKSLDGEEVLAKIAKMPITSWNYKWESNRETPNIGPMAQDFKSAFYPGRDDKKISTLEFDGVEMASIKALEKRTTDLAVRNKALERVNSELNNRLKKLEALVSTLAANVKK